jgi:hypothetical protein
MEDMPDGFEHKEIETDTRIYGILLNICRKISEKEFNYDL